MSTDPTGVVVVTTTVDDESSATSIATKVVEERLAACAQVGGPLRSVYRWQGAVERAEEWSVAMKTSAATAVALCDRVRALHAYDVPEVVVTEVVGGDADYLAWVLESVTGTT